MTDPGAKGLDEDGGERREPEDALGGEVLHPDDGREDPDDEQQPLQLVKELYELEGRRIGVQEGRNAVVMRSLEVSDRSDRRQLEFHTERLASEEREKTRAHGLARLVIMFGGGVVLLLLVLIMLMAFFGNEAQSDIAMTMIGEGGKAIGGAGFIFLVAAAVRRFLRPPPSSD